ncbi:hypothetical protein PACTADRAFT_49692 [Pachysolen tannophilus NRRL Y-2460]|uniref:Protein RER1 n=1 Tax=Pachysolen tannophilus NRRL Y-2460 TaxID=669874 RepID=A0A1E4TX52_PACTA|nr:hypothetical protein PACTADRAFT_49692 [Pachysolen tannophilus NRRL Y-2460]
MDNEEDGSNNKYYNDFLKQVNRAKLTYQTYLDKITPHAVYRWASFYVLIFAFMLRIFMTESWYIVCYTHAIYLLNLFLAFLTPKFDPSLEQEQRDESMEEGAAAMNEEDFRPFIRRLPEFKFWYNATWATILALFSTLFKFLDIPVFWPILLMYFIILFTLTMKKQIQHMIKYKYIPWDLGKKHYSRK